MRAAAIIPPLSSQSQDALWHIHYPRPSSCGWQWVFVRLTLVSCWWIQDEKAAGLRVVVYAWVCLCQLSACTNCMDLIAHWWYNCNVELIWTQWSCWGIFLTITDIFHVDSIFQPHIWLKNTVLFSTVLSSNWNFEAWCFRATEVGLMFLTWSLSTAAVLSLRFLWFSSANHYTSMWVRFYRFYITL